MARSAADGQPVLVIHGSRFADLAGFCREFSALLSDYGWTGNLDAFNDILRGGFGTPDEGFVLRWVDSDRAREALGWQATIRYLEEKLERCHPMNRVAVEAELDHARNHVGPTLFDMIVEIIEDHGPGGDESEDRVHLELR